MENLKMSGILVIVREMSGIMIKVREMSGECQGISQCLESGIILTFAHTVVAVPVFSMTNINQIFC
jgi:hypothetical protein